MDSGFGMDIRVKSRSINCNMDANVATSSVSSWKCTHTECEAYGKWYCPFSGW